jgi:hypothetical protein
MRNSSFSRKTKFWQSSAALRRLLAARNNKLHPGGVVARVTIQAGNGKFLGESLGG